MQEVQEQLEDVGYNTDVDMQVKKSVNRGPEDVEMGSEEIRKKLSHDQKPASDVAVQRFESNLREQGIRDAATHRKAESIKKVSQRTFNGRQAEVWSVDGGVILQSDRFIGNKMPKYLYSGKRGVGKTDRR